MDLFVATAKAYRVSAVIGDAWSGGWVPAWFHKRHIGYTRSKYSKQELYAQFLHIINTQRVELLDQPRLAEQLVRLQTKKTHGRITIDHPASGNDDIANVVAGVTIYCEWLKNHTGSTTYVWGTEYMSPRVAEGGVLGASWEISHISDHMTVQKLGEQQK